MQSEGRIKIASTGKDPVSGKLVTHDYEVEGPVMIYFFAVTNPEIDEIWPLVPVGTPVEIR